MNVFRRFPWSGWLLASRVRREGRVPEAEAAEKVRTQQAPALPDGEDEFEGEGWSFWPRGER